MKISLIKDILKLVYIYLNQFIKYFVIETYFSLEGNKENK